MTRPPPDLGPGPGALLELYLEKRNALVRFFTARTGSASEAEDLVQALYFKVTHVNSAEIQHGAAFLYRLGLNLMVDHFRSARRGQARDREYQRLQSGADDSAEVSDSPSPEDATHARLRLERLLAVVRGFPPQCRRVFQMHKIEGMSHGEVAGALGISRSAVEKHMISALRRLSEAAQDENSDPAN